MARLNSRHQYQPQSYPRVSEIAVFTELSDEDRISIAAAYEMKTLTSVIGIENGDTETTYLFRTTDGEFIVTLFENGAEPLDLERAFATMDTLFAKGVPCPKPRRTSEGKATFNAAGRLVAVVTFLPGFPSRNPDLAKFSNLGGVMAQIHSAFERISDVASMDLPTGSVHGSLLNDNVFFLNDDVSGVINFRLRRDDILISEVADVLVGWTSSDSGELESDKAGAILRGYEAIRNLSQSEKAALPVFVFASAAKYYASRMANDRTIELATAAYESFNSQYVG